MAIHATIDLETIDTRPQSTVLSLGAVKFNPFDESEPHSEMYFKIQIDDQDRLGRTASDDTIEWWTKQDPKIMEEAFDQEGAITVEEALKQISKFVVGVDVLWGQGYGFDYTIIEDMYRSLGKPIPYNFWQVRDSRTLFSVCKEDPRKKIQNDLHNALADAYYQSKAIQMAYKELGATR
jgi:DNA polymerase III epsilon subunit-like protein